MTHTATSVCVTIFWRPSGITISWNFEIDQDQIKTVSSSFTTCIYGRSLFSKHNMRGQKYCNSFGQFRLLLHIQSSWGNAKWPHNFSSLAKHLSKYTFVTSCVICGFILYSWIIIFYEFFIYFYCILISIHVFPSISSLLRFSVNLYDPLAFFNKWGWTCLALPDILFLGILWKMPQFYMQIGWLTCLQPIMPTSCHDLHNIFCSAKVGA